MAEISLTADRLAALFEVCAHCGSPFGVHMGYDHKMNVCIIAGSWIDLSLSYGEKQAKEIVLLLNEWQEKREEQEAANRSIGAYI